MIWACDQLINNTAKYRDQFITDWLQGGAGTSTNMNANEVISNLAIEHLGGKLGDYSIVNRTTMLISVSPRTTHTRPLSI
ncbi:hypothetical protein [Parasutterella sp.]|uniref:hypothetical protein n=1 Tax=Parasutterella sp. TaxID=2049037 RepID=UPI0039A19250